MTQALDGGPITSGALYKVEVQADNSGQWVGNGLTFATKQEAEEYAKNLMFRWTSVREWRIVDGGAKVES